MDVWACMLFMWNIISSLIILMYEISFWDLFHLSSQVNLLTVVIQKNWRFNNQILSKIYVTGYPYHTGLWKDLKFKRIMQFARIWWTYSHRCAQPEITKKMSQLVHYFADVGIFYDGFFITVYSEVQNRRPPRWSIFHKIFTKDDLIQAPPPTQVY